MSWFPLIMQSLYMLFPSGLVPRTAAIRTSAMSYTLPFCVKVNIILLEFLLFCFTGMTTLVAGLSSGIITLLVTSNITFTSLSSTIQKSGRINLPLFRIIFCFFHFFLLQWSFQGFLCHCWCRCTAWQARAYGLTC